MLFLGAVLPATAAFAADAGRDQAALIKALAQSKISLIDGLRQATKSPRAPISAKFEFDDKGKLSLSVYTVGKGLSINAEGNVLKELSGSAAILSYPQHYWLRFGRTFVELEWDYLSAVTALHSRDAEPEATLARAQAAQGIGLRDRTTTLFRMAWEDVQNSQHLDQTIHPAFGIAVWLALADAQSIDSTDPRLSARIHFREAMGTVLAHAIVWARRFRSTAIPPQMGQLLLPEIFDLARSQRFDKRNL